MELFYTNVALRYSSDPTEQLARSSFATVGQVFTDQPIRTKPYVVRNHDTQAREVIFQDEDNVLRLVSSDQRVLWQDSLSGPIVSDVQQLDFYDNGKLQYLFATDSAIHLLNRNGSSVEDTRCTCLPECPFSTCRSLTTIIANNTASW